ncbi:conserved hypothetical protein (plasmid) [Borreliella garinii PBr]|uniref:Uncharacterized protein n=1 Tax=Borreliella garinii PBr TaxID=498743 RepID=B8F1C6_BORGR|nr:conserved hypothetical protein [Borreliella garinii PBr]
MLVVRGLFGNNKLYVLRIISNFYLENPLIIDVIIFAMLDIAIRAIIIIIINLLITLSFSNKNFS